MSLLIRPSSFLTDDDHTAFTTKLTAAIRAGNVGDLGALHLLFGGGFNAVIPMKAFFQLLHTIPDYRNALVYIRALGTKHMLRWPARESASRTLEAIKSLFDLRHDVQHRLDVCLGITVLDHGIFLSRQHAYQFAVNNSVQPRFYHPLLLATYCNMQGSRPGANAETMLHSVNFYSDMLSNLRVGGADPTNGFQSILKRVLLHDLQDTDAIYDAILATNKILGDVQLLVTQLQNRAWTLRLEVTTVYQRVEDAVELLRIFCTNATRDNRLDCAKFGLIPVTDAQQYLSKIIDFGMKTLRHIGMASRTAGSLPAARLIRLAQTEELLFGAVLYGRIGSTNLRQCLAASRAVASDVIAVAFFGEDDYTNLGDLTDYVSQKDSTNQYYLIKLIRDIEHAFGLGGSAEDMALRFAIPIVSCLNAELWKQKVNSKYLTIDKDLRYLSGIRTVARAPPPSTLLNLSEVVEAMEAVFFIKHEIMYAKFGDLHELALKK